MDYLTYENNLLHPLINHFKHLAVLWVGANHSRKMKGIVLFNDALNTFYLWLYTRPGLGLKRPQG